MITQFARLKDSRGAPNGVRVIAVGVRLLELHSVQGEELLHVDAIVGLELRRIHDVVDVLGRVEQSLGGNCNHHDQLDDLSVKMTTRGYFKDFQDCVLKVHNQ